MVNYRKYKKYKKCLDLKFILLKTHILYSK